MVCAATFEFELAPNARRSLFVSVLCGDKNEPRITPFGRAFRARRRAIRGKATGIATIESSNELFNEVCRQATADLYMLMTQTRHGLYPYAGIPWYSTAFGRDGIITAMLLLWLDPSVAKALSRCLKQYTRNRRLTYFQAAATAARHMFIADARKLRWVLAEVRWRSTLKVL